MLNVQGCKFTLKTNSLSQEWYQLEKGMIADYLQLTFWHLLLQTLIQQTQNASILIAETALVWPSIMVSHLDKISIFNDYHPLCKLAPWIWHILHSILLFQIHTCSLQALIEAMKNVGILYDRTKQGPIFTLLRQNLLINWMPKSKCKSAKAWMHLRMNSMTFWPNSIQGKDQLMPLRWWNVSEALLELRLIQLQETCVAWNGSRILKTDFFWIHWGIVLSMKGTYWTCMELFLPKIFGCLFSFWLVLAICPQICS